MYKKTQPKSGSAMLILVLTSMLSFVFSSCTKATSENVMIGNRQFVITTMEANKPETKVTEQVIFKDSIFDNLQCHEWGFSSAVYQAKKTGENYTFEANMLSTSEGSMIWSGMIMGDSIHGTMIWKKSGQADIQYTFSGTTGLLPEKKEISLDGKVYATNTMEPGKPETAYDEDWTFEEGTLRSPSCEPYGFSKSPYKAYQEGDKISLTCTFQSDTNGYMNFTAAILGESLTGHVVWVKTGQADIHYDVTGNLKK